MPFTVNPPDCKLLEASFGGRLREQRKTLGLTQEAIAALLDVAVRSIKGYEAGSTTVASDVIYKMMSIGIDVGHLFYGRSVNSQSGLPQQIDLPALNRAIAWVDGEWGNESDGSRISDQERIKWIVIAYASVANAAPEEAEGLPQSVVGQRQKKSA